MSERRRYYALSSIKDEVLDAPLEWKRGLGRRFICRGCCCSLYSEGATEPEIWVEGRPKAAISVVFRSLPCIKAGLASWLQEHGADLVLGAVRFEGKVLKSHRCYHTPRGAEILIHSGPGTPYRICDKCSRTLPEGWYPPDHLVRDEAGDRPVVVNYAGRIMVDDRLLGELPIRSFPDLWTTEIPLLEAPLDDLSVRRQPPTR
jgi:hypothetical protein